MEGYRDPFNRACYPWGKEGKNLLQWYQGLGQLRAQEKEILGKGMYRTLYAEGNLLAFERFFVYSRRPRQLDGDCEPQQPPPEHSGHPFGLDRRNVAVGRSPGNCERSLSLWVLSHKISQTCKNPLTIPPSVCIIKRLLENSPCASSSAG